MKNKLIFSAELSTMSSYQNNRRTMSLIQTINNMNISFIKAIGSYKGSKETSFIVSSKHINIVLDLMNLFSQESILVLDSKGQASLRFADNNVIDLMGRMMQIESNELPEAYTIVNNKVFAVKAA